VDAVRQAARGDVVEDGLEIVELVADGGPAVDDQEYVAVRVLREPAGTAHPAVGGHRLYAILGEQLLALRQQ